MNGGSAPSWWLKSIPIVLLGWAIPPLAMRMPGYDETMAFGWAMFIALTLFGQLPAFWSRREGGQAMTIFLLCCAGPLAIFGPFFITNNPLAMIGAVLILGGLTVIVAPISALLIYFLVKPEPPAD